MKSNGVNNMFLVRFDIFILVLVIDFYSQSSFSLAHNVLGIGDGRDYQH